MNDGAELPIGIRARVPFSRAGVGLRDLGRASRLGVVVFGAHVVLFSADAEADREFLGAVFGLDSVDAGGGWLIFGLPPAEVAVHPAEVPGAELYFMCDDLGAEMQRLGARGIECSDVEEARWGAVTKVRLPGGGEVGVYQPRHPTMVDREGS